MFQKAEVVAMTDLMNSEVQALFDKVRSLLDGDGQDQFFAYIGGRVGVMGEGFAREYAPEPNGRPLELFYDRTSAAKKPYKTLTGETRKPGQSFKSKFKTQKQQGAVILKMQKGGTGRTGILGNSMTHLVVVVRGGALVSVGTNVDYAERVIGSRDVQNKYHAASGWLPLDENIDSHVPEFRDEIVTSGSAYLKGYLSR
jgi:hypothetical protein